MSQRAKTLVPKTYRSKATTTISTLAKNYFFYLAVNPQGAGGGTSSSRGKGAAPDAPPAKRLKKSIVSGPSRPPLALIMAVAAEATPIPTLATWEAVAAEVTTPPTSAPGEADIIFTEVDVPGKKSTEEEVTT